ncbi:MAG: histidine phosphatase family protein [Flavisolibacter sp.]|nr:histidine phosphatase family protein [Flavisolibacter sp.]MBD0287573.1 histidine phosphatase family protein [Flavisolibacter sp.]MBD0297313.1 histidine phosphatase family protein [Flavisolibacter sp.]MBD0349850.1 histidine phosphatase family protein [Flavisolibacter sp.]MBD0374672.1 histidine phosphatase family protein [Flavisolibacter sp.]
MKTLIVVRHAKSSWNEPGLDDRERPLNERGKKDAPRMAKRLKEKDIAIELFVSSPAKRARQTARCFVDEFDVRKKEIVLEEKLYGAAPESFYDVIAALPDKCDTVALFAHNPGITDFVNTLTNVHVDNMPTCAVFAVHADTDKWVSFKETDKSFLFFDYPKNPLPT